MAVPLSPPYSHTDSSKSTQNVNQGETHNSNIQNIGGVIAGNIAGFNNIVGMFEPKLFLSRIGTDQRRNA